MVCTADHGRSAACVWVLARTETAAREKGEPVLREVCSSSSPVGPVEVFPRSEYQLRHGPRDFTAGVLLNEPDDGR